MGTISTESEIFQMTLLSVAAASGSRAPTHNLREVRAGFCNNHDSRIIAPSSQGRPIFSPYFPCLPPEEQDEWISIWLAAKFTHQVVMIDDPTYPEVLPQYGTFWPGPSFAPTTAQFSSALTRLLTAGFTPIVFATTGEFPADMSLFGQFEQKIRSYLLPFANQIITCSGWEPYWTRDQWQQMFDLLRRVLGPDAILAVHLPANYADGTGDPLDWTTCFAEVDVFLLQLDPPYNAGQIATMGAGWSQVLCRALGQAGCPNYMAGRTRPITICVFEHVAYPQIRGWITDVDIDTVMAWDTAQGVRWLGNSNGF